MKQLLLGFVGAVLGGFIPCASFTIARYECNARPWMWLLVAGGFLFSSFTVFDWARRAFGHPVKALGFVALSEGVLVLSHTAWLSIAGLAILVVLNAIATAGRMAFADETKETHETSNITTLGLSSYQPPAAAVSAKRAKKRSNSTERVRAWRAKQKADQARGPY